MHLLRCWRRPVVDGAAGFRKRDERDGVTYDNARFKRRGLPLSCNPSTATPTPSYARAEEIARADVERPDATKTLHFNSRSPEARRPRLRRRVVAADYDDLVLDRTACAPPPKSSTSTPAPPEEDAARRGRARADKEDIEKQFLDEVEGIESNATNATEPEKKNSSAPADPEACEAATKAVEAVSLHKIELLIEAECVPTVYDFGIKGWAGNSNLQVLGAHNDSEADRRGCSKVRNCGGSTAC